MMLCYTSVMTAVQKRRDVRRKLKRAIQHAQLICPNFEDTIECRQAWDEVTDYEKVLNKQNPIDKTCLSERAKRDYDS